MSNIFLSKSSIETFIKCQSKFDLHYIKRVQGLSSAEDRQSAIFGVLIHEVLEKYFKLEKKVNILDIYKDEFKKCKDITDQKYYILGDQLISDYARDSGSGQKILGLEQEFEFYLSNGVPVKGIIDRVNEISSDEIEIEDYKTGYSRPLTEDQLEEDIQLGIYDLAAIEYLYPQYKKYKLTLNYLHYGKVSVYRNDAQRNRFKDYLLIIYNKINDAINLGKDLPATVNSYCSFCDYKFRCPAFQSTIKDKSDANTSIATFKGLINPETNLVVDIDKLDVFLDTVDAKIKILKKIKEDGEKFILNFIKQNGTKNVKIGNTNYYSDSSESVLFDVNDVIEVCKLLDIDLNKMLKARKTDIVKMLAGKKDMLDKLKSTQFSSFGAEKLNK